MDSAALNDPLDLARSLYGFEGNDKGEASRYAMTTFEATEAYGREIWLEVLETGVLLGPVVNNDRIRSGVEELEFPFDLEDLVAAIQEIREIAHEITQQWREDWIRSHHDGMDTGGLDGPGVSPPDEGGW